MQTWKYQKPFQARYKDIVEDQAYLNQVSFSNLTVLTYTEYLAMIVVVMFVLR